MKLPYPKALHNHKKLNDYDAFSNFKNRFICFAFLIDFKTIQIISQKDVSINISEISIGLIDYNSAHSRDSDFPTIPLGSEEYSVTKVNEDIYLKLTKKKYPANYIVFYKEDRIIVRYSPEIGGILDTCFDASDEQNFGVYFDRDVIYFSCWSPPAARIDLVFFDKEQNVIPDIPTVSMNISDRGVWRGTLPLSIAMKYQVVYYQFLVYAYGKKTIACDPYAFSMASFDPESEDKIGKAALIDLASTQANPDWFRKTFHNGQVDSEIKKIIAYELHVRDFTIQPELIDAKEAGTFKGAKRKVSYLKELGITHIQLMPLTKFHTVSDKDRAYTDETSRIPNYNWGYDPQNFFSPEGWLCTNPESPYVRITELKELIQSLHESGIGIIMDVVFNHTYAVETFENIAPGCYYRYTDDFRISGTTGAGPGIESRRVMVRKLITDALSYFVTFFHVDGFRFDLMNFLNHELLVEIRAIVGKLYNPENINELILYGEGWEFTDLPAPDAVRKTNFPKQIQLGFFNDACKNSILGHFPDSGLINGNQNFKHLLSTVSGGLNIFTGGILQANIDKPEMNYSFFASETQECINYLTVHDGLTLWDSIRLSTPNSSKAEQLRLMRFAFTILFTSQGQIVLQGGDEMLRSKLVSEFDKEISRTFPFKDGDKFIHFHENSYCSTDYTNMFRWNDDPDAVNMREFLKGLIRFRTSFPAFEIADSKEFLNRIHFVKGIRYHHFYNFFQSFSDTGIQQMTLRFVNGPADSFFYIAGEIHPQGIDGNPAHNLFLLQFNSEGMAELTFTQEQIALFDIGKWGEGKGLKIKLVRQAGKWETPYNAYSPDGNTVIFPEAITKDLTVEIDLSVQNFRTGFLEVEDAGCFAFMLNNTPKIKQNKTETSLYKTLLVIYNSSDYAIPMDDSLIHNSGEWEIILDSGKYEISEQYPFFHFNKHRENRYMISEKSCVIFGK